MNLKRGAHLCFLITLQNYGEIEAYEMKKKT